MPDAIERLRAGLEGRYQVLDELGHGGMATVFLAEDLRHSRKVAIKVLRPELAASLGPRRFLREIEIAAQLHHPHILPLYDSGEANGQLFYVMPHEEGRSLREKLEREGELPVSEAIRLLRDLLDALAYAHMQGVVHRDIKPENILLSGRHALVTDFGIAKAISEAGAEEERLTSAGVTLGTPVYMSPEQAAAEAQVDHRSDIYAAGLVAYEMLTGSPPFTGGTNAQLLVAQVTQPPRDVTELRPSVPVQLAQLVMQCLEKKPADRPQSAAELVARLEGMLTAEAGLTAVAGRRASASKRIRISFAARGVAVLVVSAILIGLLGFSVVARRNAERGRMLATAHRELDRFIALRLYDSAWAVSERIGRNSPRDSVMLARLPEFAVKATFRTEPPGARVWVRRYSHPDTAWEALGTTPTEPRWLPLLVHRVRIEKPGYSPLVIAGRLPGPGSGSLQLPVGVPDGMALIPGGPTEDEMPFGFPKFVVPGFYIDRYETTNAEYAEFVAAGGYRDPRYWIEPFMRDGSRLPFDSAIRYFEDSTGRLGPASWEGGGYPTGTGDQPVGGLSWYEAAAYAAFRGKHLPSVYEWRLAANVSFLAVLSDYANTDTRTTRPVHASLALSPTGAFDMAGNVREWTLTARTGGRFLLGGGADEPDYMFNSLTAVSEWDRSAYNGVRLVTRIDTTNQSVNLARVAGTDRDMQREAAVSDDLFQAYASLYRYDPTPLEPRVERTGTLPAVSRYEDVTFTAAYGGRARVRLLLPESPAAPHPLVVWLSGSGMYYQSRSDDAAYHQVDFLVKAGFAVAMLVTEGAFERRDSANQVVRPGPTKRYAARVIRAGNDLSRFLDYAGTRPDLDTARVAYYGWSLGSQWSPMLLAVEPRVKAAVLVAGGFMSTPLLPEIAPVNYVSRVRIPVLMINGRRDPLFTLNELQLPMYRRLGTPPEHKKHFLSSSGHNPLRSDVIRETLDWLERYLE